MGMAASQARFLGITARKTNTEYEGQQVNQQRTALANQSANLFNQLLGLDLPVPPNKNDVEYTKTVYSFIDDNAEKATIESIINNPDINTNAQWPKIIKYTTQENDSLSYRNNLLTTGSIASHRLENGELYHQITIGTTPTELFKLVVNSDTNYKKDQQAKLNIYNSIKAANATDADGGEEKAEAGTSNLYHYGDNYVNLGADVEWTTTAKALGAQNNSSLVRENGAFYIKPTGKDTKVALGQATQDDIANNGLGAGNWYKYNANGKDWFYNLADVTWTANVSQYDENGRLIKNADNTDKLVTINDNGSNFVSADAEPITLTAIDNLDNGTSISGGTITDLAMIKDIQDSYKETAGDSVFYKYVIGTQAYYVPESQTIGDWNVADTERDATHTPLTLKTDVPTEPPYGYFVQDAEVTSTKEYRAKVTYDSSGRLQSILLDNGTNAPYSISVNSITDEDKYEDAMNQYKYDLAQYDKTVEDINAQTEIIQVQDRTLELRLKQLDTEQEALTQEMDAIKKVIDKNVETTFKTFA